MFKIKHQDIFLPVNLLGALIILHFLDHLLEQPQPGQKKRQEKSVDNEY